MLPAKWQFLSYCPLKGKNLVKTHIAVFSMTVLLNKVKLHSQEKNENKCSGNQEQPCSESRVGFLNSGSHPSLCPMSFD